MGSERDARGRSVQVRERLSNGTGEAHGGGERLVSGTKRELSLSRRLVPWRRRSSATQLTPVCCYPGRHSDAEDLYARAILHCCRGVRGDRRRAPVARHSRHDDGRHALDARLGAALVAARPAVSARRDPGIPRACGRGQARRESSDHLQPAGHLQSAARHRQCQLRRRHQAELQRGGECLQRCGRAVAAPVC